MEFTDKFNDRLEEITESLIKSNDTYAYIKSTARYYWIEKKTFFKTNDVANNLMCTNKELNGLRQYDIIKTYNDICYYKGGKYECLNLLNEKKILIPSGNPILDNNIKELIDNVCGYKKENIDYLHKAILYKYINVNDFTIPAVVFYGSGGSGKGTFISLLGTIFGEENTLANLGQRDLGGNFDTYTGQKIIVEFAELSTNNTNADYAILNKLKNLIGAEKIMVNEKSKQIYQIDNIAWFFISSNSNKPLQLDDKDKGNRRFSIISSTNKLKNGKNINKVIRDINLVSNYLSWLKKEYPEVLKYDKLEALDNDDKKVLEDRTQSQANDFWDWFFEKFPNHEKKLRKTYIDDLIGDYCNDNNLDKGYFIKYFRDHSRYGKTKIRLGDKTYSGVYIK